ncbi:5'/3'-nucleotidase SurE [Candidatus Kinetoplastidibacterium crithidiae]|uniref:5'-nucleotidase SurE n=1 Tax=Candidatus Kinetoplastidibacterium crithidiae TCC036E TaxID=1208918 RepID=M1M5Y2_9PROT|nr:5'/3'-nucleotidase SurE [Candidatus Kinetoplastibacterium crithidii]AFZ82792.1 5'-3'-nucleotidase SurE [Candidatus Kinetoplastibacterium crithidii (ex Angomonas deanei ATCC 30255)]AGF47555.1 5'-nucleotidase [Candidatus Kinetoplastibacterium crithidii TCC036E]
MRILLSNDDGYHAKGLKKLADSLQSIVDLQVVVPESNCSGVSNSLTLNRPLNVHINSDGFMILNGTPTDCVHLSLTGLLDKKPDLVISGINNGANMGNDVLYSGTVAAAREAYVLGVPAIAFSLVGKGWNHIDSAVRIASIFVKSYIDCGIDSLFLLNINIPDVSLSAIKGISVTKLGKRLPSKNMIKSYNPYGDPVYWIGQLGPSVDDIEGTDFHAISKNHISVTLLEIDSYVNADISFLKEWVSKIDI